MPQGGFHASSKPAITDVPRAEQILVDPVVTVMAPALARALYIRHALVDLPELVREELVWMPDDWGAISRHTDSRSVRHRDLVGLDV
jgi:hypothetical protein